MYIMCLSNLLHAHGLKKVWFGGICFAVSLLAIQEHEELQTKLQFEKDLKNAAVEEAQKVGLSAVVMTDDPGLIPILLQ